MPTYLFVNNDTGEEYQDFMSISQLDEYLKSNPNVTQLVFGSPSIVDPTRVGLRKPDSGFRDVLKKIKSAHRGSTVNTW